MTLAEIITDVRNLTNEISTDAGALLSDSGNLLPIIYDAQEQVVMDLLSTMKDQFLTSETVTLVANTKGYALTTSFWQIYKVAKNVTDENPKEIEVVDPLNLQYYEQVGETADEPHACYFLGSTIYFVPTPAAAKTDYARVWMLRPEAATMGATGPAYIPALAHRLIVYKACMNIAIMLEADMKPFAALYAQRLMSVKRIWWGRVQSQPRFLRESTVERTVHDTREKAFYDLEWP